MGSVIAQAMMSVDGYIAKDDNTIGRLFDWLQNGDVELVSPRGDMTLHLTSQSAEHMRSWIATFGVLVCGRTLFDVTDGWDGRHDFDVPVVVVTHRVPAEWVEAHPTAPFVFVTDGVEAAIADAQQIAGNLAVDVTAGVIAGECLEHGCSTRWRATWSRSSWAAGGASPGTPPSRTCRPTHRTVWGT